MSWNPSSKWVVQGWWILADVDRGYRQEVLLSESFTALPGRKALSDVISNFLGVYVPEGNHRERMAAKRHVDKEDLFALESLSDADLASRLEQALTDSDQGIPDDSRSTGASASAPNLGRVRQSSAGAPRGAFSI
ncbi:hypothetical protein [Pseudoclavibacter sp. 13-3]|uniref:hypothetical protein n=1 Tax=Pseudoclavibacter sp. 13-3 TaxID=2901228 RepID=UPI001E483BC5|nr:hypothetical protein [Pseudoclavibacter sp. 13-3]MCD7100734.1 hypothetical protein [Pseudoclavibacter sp. 13-3]